MANPAGRGAAAFHGNEAAPDCLSRIQTVGWR
jgi:hypothetical protein